MYFHVVYGGAKRRYGGTGRNSLLLVAPNNTVVSVFQCINKKNTQIENKMTFAFCTQSI